MFSELGQWPKAYMMKQLIREDGDSNSAVEEVMDQISLEHGLRIS